MFGAVIRVSIGFAGCMLLATVLREAATPLVNIIIDNGGENGQAQPIINAIGGSIEYAPIIIIFTAALALIARGLVEARVG
jgi:hypothetical protein